MTQSIQLQRLVGIVTVDQQERGGNGIEFRVILDHETIFGF
jgi:hypothetical protein